MSQDSKGRKIAYWIATAFIALGFTTSGILNLMAGDEVVAQYVALGYPAYLPRFLGLAKVLGAIALVAPKFPRLKEWAYAGITFDLLGAAYSHIANGDPIGDVVAPIVLLAVLAASYFLRPTDRRLPDPT